MDQPTRASTEELLRMLFAEPNLEHWMRRGSSSAGFPSFADYITALCRTRDEPPERVIKRANLERSYGHSLFNGRRKPSRDTALQLAFAFGLDYAGAQELLKAARKSPLYPRVRRDLVLIYCLHNGCTLLECQESLQQYGLPLLGEGSRNE